MSLDLLVRGGTVVDGTGAPARRADVGIQGGKIVAVGEVDDASAKTIDATDLVVAPGFIDPHTHYDAQICWDPEVSCSSWHGVTTVVMGNCGVGIAPCRPETREVATWDLVNVEAIPFDVLSKGISWDWVTFPEYMDAAGRRGSALNLAFLAPLTPFRHFVMGDESMERAANAEETAEIARLLGEAVDAGAFGFTTSLLPQHVGFGGRPLASQLASRAELSAYANQLRDRRRGVIEVALTKSPGVISDEELDTLDFLVSESTGKVTWLALLNREDRPEACQESLAKADALIRRGAVPQVTCRPLTVQIDLRNPFIFADTRTWKPAFNQPVEKQREIYAAKAFRDAVRDELREPRIFSGNWERLEVKEVENPRLKSLEGRTVADIARERGVDGVDAFLDLGIEDDLRMQFSCALFNADERRIPELLTDPRTLIGLSDGGAHVDMLCDAGYASHFLGHWVRDEQVLSLEHAIQRLTAEPADYLGIRDRGRLAPGLAADVVLFDPRTIAAAPRPEMRHDLPGGGRRLVVESSGIERVIVNGTIVREGSRATGETPGRVVRSSAS